MDTQPQKAAHELPVNPTMMDILRRDQDLNPHRYPRPYWLDTSLLDTSIQSTRSR